MSELGYTPTPEDTVNELFRRLVEELANYESEHERFKQVTPETDEKLRKCYNQMRHLTVEQVGYMTQLDKKPKDVIAKLQTYLVRLNRSGFYSIGRKQARLLQLHREGKSNTPL